MYANLFLSARLPFRWVLLLGRQNSVGWFGYHGYLGSECESHCVRCLRMLGYDSERKVESGYHGYQVAHRLRSAE